MMYVNSKNGMSSKENKIKKLNISKNKCYAMFKDESDDLVNKSNKNKRDYIEDDKPI